MSQFEQAMSLVRKHEGGLVYDPIDPGGITNEGISLRFLRAIARQHPDIIPKLDINKNQIIDPPDIIALSTEEVTRLYQTFWWDHYEFSKIKHQFLANKLFDSAVNIGPKLAITLLQKAYEKLFHSNDLLIDGKLGEVTIKYINALNQEQSMQFLQYFCELIADYYRNLVKKFPAFRKFLKGWLKRAYEYNS